VGEHPRLGAAVGRSARRVSVLPPVSLGSGPMPRRGSLATPGRRQRGGVPPGRGLFRGLVPCGAAGLEWVRRTRPGDVGHPTHLPLTISDHHCVGRRGPPGRPGRDPRTRRRERLGQEHVGTHRTGPHRAHSGHGPTGRRRGDQGADYDPSNVAPASCTRTRTTHCIPA
jgi:hypothetical protein